MVRGPDIALRRGIGSLRCIYKSKLSATLLFLALVISGANALATHRAVLVGVNEYAAASVPDLKGTANGVALMQSLLVNRYAFQPENIVILRDSQAKRAAILAALETLITQSQRDDVVVFYFSGHGSPLSGGARASAAAGSAFR